MKNNNDYLSGLKFFVLFFSPLSKNLFSYLFSYYSYFFKLRAKLKDIYPTKKTIIF